MDDAVHVEVEVVELEAVGVGAGEVEGEVGAVGADDGFLLHDVGDGERVPVGEPPVERRNTHRRRDDRKGEGRDPAVRKTVMLFLPPPPLLMASLSTSTHFLLVG